MNVVHRNNTSCHSSVLYAAATGEQQTHHEHFPYPDLYDGAAIWAGCAYLCSDPDGELVWQAGHFLETAAPARV